ncbi:MAG: ABC transporter ATP-binding protein, partial [Candidatus Adiutrix sp.]
MSGLKLLFPFFKKYQLMIFCGFMALIICDIAQLFIPRIMGQGIDLLSAEGTEASHLLTPVTYILLIAA